MLVELSFVLAGMHHVGRKDGILGRGKLCVQRLRVQANALERASQTRQRKAHIPVIALSVSSLLSNTEVVTRQALSHFYLT
jgi:hypothetical protein